MWLISIVCSCMMLSALSGNLAGEVTSVDSITITTVYDNEPFVEDLTPSWGFSCLIQGLEKNILFDTGGDGNILLANMEKLGLDPEDVHIVVLSHLHGDHTGGLADILRVNPRVTVYMPNSFPEHLKGEVTQKGAELVTVGEPVEICRGAFLTGEMGTTIQEQALVIKMGGGLVVITGCAHPGIVDVIERSRKIGKDSVLLAMGGFHLFGASRQRLREVLEQFRVLGVAKVSPCHCTGPEAIGMFQDAYGKNYIQGGVGQVISLPR